MVQYRNKPVSFVKPLTIRQDDAEVWIISQTKELFTDYETFLNRRDFYLQKQFTCTKTGRNKLSFFQALRSELTGQIGESNPLPEALREHVLRRVQFSNVPRLDDLVASVYDHFKDNFFPTEAVIVTTDKDEQQEGVIREKISFHEVRGPDGNVTREAQDRYFVRLRDGNQPEGEKLVDHKHLMRDRKVFSKQILRAYLKDSIFRDPHPQAPWLVKKDVAQAYKIPLEPPGQIQQFSVPIPNQPPVTFHYRKDQQPGQGTFFNFLATQQQQQGRPLGPKPDQSFQQRPLIFPQVQPGMGQQQPMPPQFQQQFIAPGQNHVPQQVLSNAPGFQNIQPYTNFRQHHPVPPPPAVKQPVQKYPTEDLELAPKPHAAHRPLLKRLKRAEEADDDEEGSGESANIIQAKTIGPMLEVWNTLNVHAEVFVLDSFTFDDFVDAMCYSSEDRECELLTEMHCAVMKQVVGADGKRHVHLPDIEEQEEEDEEENENEEESDREPTPPVRTTRSSLAKSEAAALAAHRSPSPPKVVHRASELLAEYSWQDRTKARDFQEGGWEVVLVGILRQLSGDSYYKERCDEILSELCPLHLEPTAETVRSQYIRLDVNLRVEALQMITMLTISTSALRSFLDQMMEQMTDLRKKKIGFQRERKAEMEHLRNLDDQRKLLVPQVLADPSQAAKVLETNGSINVQTPTPLVLSEAENTDEEDDDEAPVRSMRSTRGRDNDKKRKREEEEKAKKEKKAKEAAKAKLTGPAAQLQKLDKQIEDAKERIKEAEDNIVECESDLRETNCQRTKVLGKDRFCNRYYWFERNGMPFEGLPESSTAHCGYANARIWVQGPDQMEREGFLELDPSMNARYIEFMGMTVAERRNREEGETQLYNAHEWGYIDNPDDLDRLIGWLDERGVREKALRRELQIWREQIVRCMQALKDWQDNQEAERKKRTETPEGRVNTRHGEREKSHDEEVTKHPCLAWTNSWAENKYGHIHSQQPKPKLKKEKAKKNVTFDEDEPIAVKGKARKSGGKSR